MNRQLRQKIVEHCAFLIKIIGDDVPDFIIAQRLVLLWECAEAELGKDLYEELGRLRRGNSRLRHGICLDCDSELAFNENFTNRCGPCEKKLDDETDALLKKAAANDVRLYDSDSDAPGNGR